MMPYSVKLIDFVKQTFLFVWLVLDGFGRISFLEKRVEVGMVIYKQSNDTCNVLGIEYVYTK